ncbi:MAG: phospholipase D-like domain-containing protein [Candidatus Desantisbacteria bacterium]
MIARYSSRATRLDKQFLNDKLHNAQSYDRIAGYFSSSVLEITGEAIESISGKVRLICNSQIEKEDCETATAAAAALRLEWCENKPEKVYAVATPRLKRLYEFIKSNKLEIKILPNNVFGLIHGKAGVITLSDGSKTSFIGSVNETLSAWRLNYEWWDGSPLFESLRLVESAIFPLRKGG